MKRLSAFAALFLLFDSLQAEVSFITEAEYASQLYHSPRGIGCHKCHGDQGEGRLIASYKDKGEDKVFHPPAINQIGYDAFVDAMKKRQKGMPRYFLTANEIKALFFYLHQKESDNAH
ncbi:cytochrome c [Sulfurimonas sp. HSL3-7]|uniref:c-type cytochrome n=1 Tax=Sulfonitrofixus jiaomeiensis TaxID=3131938 RepID=UPI0031F891E5